ncbi:hypothetical protein AAEP93_011284 [Penicillium crustosum]
MDVCNLGTNTFSTLGSPLDEAQSANISDGNLLTPHSSFDISQPPSINQMDQSTPGERNGVEIMDHAAIDWNILASRTVRNGLSGMEQSSCMESDQEMMKKAVNTLRIQKRNVCQRIEELFGKILELYTHGVLLELLQEDHVFQDQLLADKKKFLSLIQ